MDIVEKLANYCNNFRYNWMVGDGVGVCWVAMWAKVGGRKMED